MPNAIRFHKNGGPEVMQWESVDVGEPGPGEARVRHTAIGVNYIDTYHRSGLYKLALPSGLGTEGAGVVEAVGPGVTDVRPGDRVAYSGGPLGAYSEVRVMPADRLVKLPDGVSDKVAATLMLKGLTVQYLFRQTFPLKGGETILLHAAAGGIGLIACQWARALGVTVIGTVGSDGKGVPVVYDGVGKDTFPASLDCLSPRGMFVSFGNASGAIAAFDILLLAQKGSLYASRPTLATYTASRAAMLAMSEEMFSLVLSGKLTSEPRQTYALKDAAQAHRDLQARKTTGATILLP
jgi:NADPH:quinone reductase